jgi:serine protease Do
VLEGASTGGVKLPWIGVDGQAITSDIAKTLDLPRPGGVLLKSVYAQGPVGRAGLTKGDIIFAVDGVEVDDMQSLNYRIATHKPGDVVNLHVHKDGKPADIAVKLQLPPENPPRETTTIKGRNPMTGATVENLSPATADDFSFDSNAKGVVVVSTAPGTPADGYGFQRGDIVVEMNGVRINRVGDLTRALDLNQGGWSMIVNRGGRQMQLSVRG